MNFTRYSPHRQENGKSFLAPFIFSFWWYLFIEEVILSSINSRNSCYKAVNCNCAIFSISWLKLSISKSKMLEIISWAKSKSWFSDSPKLGIFFKMFISFSLIFIVLFSVVTCLASLLLNSSWLSYMQSNSSILTNSSLFL